MEATGSNPVGGGRWIEWGLTVAEGHGFSMVDDGLSVGQWGGWNSQVGGEAECSLGLRRVMAMGISSEEWKFTVEDGGQLMEGD